MSKKINQPMKYRYRGFFICLSVVDEGQETEKFSATAAPNNFWYLLWGGTPGSIKSFTNYDPRDAILLAEEYVNTYLSIRRAKCANAHPTVQMVVQIDTDYGTRKWRPASRWWTVV